MIRAKNLIVFSVANRLLDGKEKKKKKQGRRRKWGLLFLVSEIESRVVV